MLKKRINFVKGYMSTGGLRSALTDIEKDAEINELLEHCIPILKDYENTFTGSVDDLRRVTILLGIALKVSIDCYDLEECLKNE